MAIASLFGVGLACIQVACAQPPRHPVYVGHRECATCHAGPDMGHQQSRWLLSAHARAYSALAKPEAKQIARLSGIPQEPQESPVCLGCHTTGADAEAWEMDPTFSLRDGVQCEKCHGPGSEYMDESIMTDREAALAAGLQIPTKEDCMACHSSKGSHDAVLDRPPFDLEQAWQEIEHPTPEDWDYLEEVSLPEGDSETAYTGTDQCGRCHHGPAMGYQFSRWQQGPHARAFASLSTERAREIAGEMGITENPQTSTACLRCHATAFADPAARVTPDYAIYEGVGCEACHGPGGRHIAAVENEQAPATGLLEATEQTCRKCHDRAHGKPFSFDEALRQIAHPTHLPPPLKEIRYKNPINMAVHPAGNELWVACEASDSVIVIDLTQKRKMAEISVGGQATDVAFSPDGQWAYVSNRLDDSVSILRTDDRQVVGTIAAGDEPHGLLTDPSGKYLFVCNTLTDDISVIDLPSRREVKRLSAGRRPWSIALSPDGRRFVVSNALSQFVPFRTPSVTEVTVVDAERGTIDNRARVEGANLLLGIAWHPSGRFAMSTLNRTKNLIPMTRLLQGWTITNGLAILWDDGRVDQVLLDEPSMCFPDPTDVAFTPDGKWALVTSAASNRVAVIDVQKLLAMIESASPYERAHVLPNHLGKPTEFVVTHIPTKDCPRGITVHPNGREAYVANTLDDSISVIDLEKWKAVRRIDLGGPKTITKVRYGERLFHSANITFHRQFACNTCHPDGHVDGLTYDIEPDGIGTNPVDNRTLRGILDTAPFKWTGINPSLRRQCGPRLAVFFTRIEPFTPEQLSALEEYICTIPRPPNRHRPFGADLTEAQRRGKAIFERATTNDGRPIPKEQQCRTCHFPPLFTNRAQVDVGTKMELDHHAEFDVPHLSNIYDSPPYLHNGIAETLEEIWTRYNPNDTHGVTNDLTKDQLNDLIEYLKTL